MTHDFRAVVEQQVGRELAERGRMPPNLDLDRLRQHWSTIQAELDGKHAAVKEAAAHARASGDAAVDPDAATPEELERYDSELGVLTAEVRRVHDVLEERQAAWVRAGEGGQVWNAQALAATSEVYTAGMALRADVARRIPETEEEPYRRVRRACGVGVTVNKSAPLAVFDLGTMQLNSLAMPEVVQVLEGRGIEVQPHVRRIRRGLRELDVQRDAGVGKRRGEARRFRDEAQKHLEILLSRVVTKVGAALGLAAAAQMESVIARAHWRRSSDTGTAADKPAATAAPAALPAAAPEVPPAAMPAAPTVPYLQDGMGE